MRKLNLSAFPAILLITGAPHGPSGVCFYRVKAGELVQVRKMMLVK